MSKIDTVIANLEQQKATLNKKIEDAKKKKAREESEVHQQRCAIIGDAVLKSAENDIEFSDQLKRILNDVVRKKSHRKMLALDVD